jgi:hypothetical protein
VIFLAWQSIVYLILAIKIDEWSNNPRMVQIWRSIVSCGCEGAGFDPTGGITSAIPDDDDVVAEQERVLSGQANNDLIESSQINNQ